MAQTRKTEREHDGLIGAVKTVRVTSARASNKAGNLAEGKPVPDHIIEYEKRGNRMKETDYNDAEEDFYPEDVARYHHSQINTAITYHYDAQGNRTDSLITDSPRVDLQTRIFKWVFKDDAKGNRISESLYSAPTDYDAIRGQSLVGTYTHSYDDNGKRKKVDDHVQPGA